MRNRTYGGVRGRKMKVGGKLLHFPPTRFPNISVLFPIALNDGKIVVPLPPKDPEMDDTWSKR